MKLFAAVTLVGATVALCAGALAASSQTPFANRATAQTQDAAALDLPDAPLSQVDGQIRQPSTSAPPATPSPSATPPVPPTGTGSDADVKKKQHDQAEQDLKVQEKQRLLGVMPQFQVVMGGKAVPLTGGQKWRLALRSAIDPFYIGWAFVIGGGWGEVEDSDSGYGWGEAGYFKRVGANYADNVNGALIGNALLPQLLHQDPRYFRMGTGPVFKRFLHAAESTVVCHGDNGKKQANVSNVLGNYLSGAISNLYYPANQRGVSLTLENGTSVTLFGALGGQILEFGPDLARLVHHKKGAPAAAIVSPTSAPVVPASPTAAGAGSNSH